MINKQAITLTRTTFVIYIQLLISFISIHILTTYFRHIFNVTFLLNTNLLTSDYAFGSILHLTAVDYFML